MFYPNSGLDEMQPQRRTKPGTCLHHRQNGRFFYQKWFQNQNRWQTANHHKFCVVKKNLNTLIFKFIYDPRHVSAAIQMSFKKFLFCKKSIKGITLICCWRFSSSLFMIDNRIGISHGFWKVTIYNSIDFWNGLICNVDWSIKMSAFILT